MIFWGGQGGCEISSFFYGMMADGISVTSLTAVLFVCVLLLRFSTHVKKHVASKVQAWQLLQPSSHSLQGSLLYRLGQASPASARQPPHARATPCLPLRHHPSCCEV